MPENRVVVGVVPRERWSLSVESLHSLLATLPDEGPTGGFFRNRHPIAW